MSVVNGTFTVQLDFSPASPFSTGANRWLEIAVRKAADPPGYTTLTPRQQITSSPYSIRTLSASSSDSLSAVCAGCVSDANVANGISYSKLSGAPTSLPPSGSAGGDLTGTYPNPAIAATAPAGGHVLASLNSASSGTVATARLGSGTANNTTFLRGDQTWAAATGNGSFYFNSFNTPLLLTATYYPLLTGGGTNQTTGTPVVALAQTNVSGTMVVDTIKMEMIVTSAAGTADVITIALWKNGSPTGMVVTGTSSTLLNIPVVVNSTGGPVTFAAGDLINYTMTHTNSTPIVSCRLILHAQ